MVAWRDLTKALACRGQTWRLVNDNDLTYESFKRNLYTLTYIYIYIYSIYVFERCISCQKSHQSNTCTNMCIQIKICVPICVDQDMLKKFFNWNGIQIQVEFSRRQREAILSEEVFPWSLSTLFSCFCQAGLLEIFFYYYYYYFYYRHPASSEMPQCLPINLWSCVWCVCAGNWTPEEVRSLSTGCKSNKSLGRFPRMQAEFFRLTGIALWISAHWCHFVDFCICSPCSEGPWMSWWLIKTCRPNFGFWGHFQGLKEW